MFDYNEIKKEIQSVYKSNTMPWIIGYSGGKDSTALLQLILYALMDLPKKDLNKDVHVITNDTLVENPVIAEYVNKQLDGIKKEGLKIFAHAPQLFHVIKVKPTIEDSFWVNLIGKGYPSPNRWFRWCTSKLKINPTSRYIACEIKDKEKVIVLGTRKAESANRAASMKNYDTKKQLRNHTLPDTFVYAPIADLSNNEVWAYLLQARNPWGGNNKQLLRMYQTACDGGECPFVIETGTASCGKSRFGCWVCTVVDKDKSMENIIDNGNEWLTGLLEFRNWLYDIRQESNNQISIPNVKYGPFLIGTRKKIKDRLVKIQKTIKYQLISAEEVNYIDNLLPPNDTIKMYVYKLSNNTILHVISDYNIQYSNRKRIGSTSIQGAELLETKRVNYTHDNLYRVAYY